VRSGFTPEVEALARVDEGCTYMAAATNAIAGNREEALRWFRHMIRDRGFVAWPYFAERDPFLESLRGDQEYESLLGEMKERWSNL
jgi:hypothetical protein